MIQFVQLKKKVKIYFHEIRQPDNKRQWERVLTKKNEMRKMTIILLLMIALKLTAPPGANIPVLLKYEAINNNEAIWQAVCKIESNGNPYAWCIDINGKPSVGIGQIQLSRVKEFNKEADKNYTHDDMFDPVKSREVFDHYASKSTYEQEIIRCWNGGPRGMAKESTVKYYRKVRARL